MVCKLCKEREANQTGSHIFTHALVSNCVNQQGLSGRDKEMMFGISDAGNTNLFVGRRISTEKIEEVKGRPLTDQEIDSNQNALIVDNVFCTYCEGLFGRIESPFSQILKEIRNNNKLEFASSVEIRLFFIIQAWRASVCRYNDWKIEANFEEYLRKLVYDGCTNFSTGLLQETVSKLTSVPMAVTFLETPAGQESNNIVLLPDGTNPYKLILCDFILQMFEPNDKIDSIKLPPFFNLNAIKSQKVLNHQEKKFTFGFMRNPARIFLLEKISKTIAPGALNGFIKKFTLYCSSNGVLADKFLISKFVSALVYEEDIPLADRYSDERINLITQNLIKGGSKL